MSLAQMLKRRAAPIAGVLALGGFLLYETYGGAKEPVSRAKKDPSEALPVSETMEAIARLGGPYARDPGPSPHDKDTRLYSKSPDLVSKKNPEKARPLDRGSLGAVNPLNKDGKHIGDRDSDLPWKKEK